MTVTRDWPRRYVWAGAAALATSVVVLTTFAVTMIRDGNDASPTEVESGSPRLDEATTLRQLPSETSSAVVALEAGVGIEPLGRSADGGWVLVEVSGEDGVAGWMPADRLLGGAEMSALPVLDTPVNVAGPTLPATPSQTVPTASPDIANLVVQVVTSRDNRLAVILGNEGNAEVNVPATLLIEGGGRHPVDFESQPLRPGGRLEVVLDGEYVQRRAQIAVTVSAPGLEEENLDDNELVATVEPDVPNDLEMLEVRVDPYLLVTLRNNSIIPVVGTVTIAVRETRPSNLLVMRVEEPLDLAAGASEVYEFPGLRGVDLERTQVILITEALNDSVRENDVFPR